MQISKSKPKKISILCTFKEIYLCIKKLRIPLEESEITGSN